MMELSEIQQYSHKIIKVSITNTNKKTSYDYVTAKIHLDRETNDTIRFSLTESPKADEWLAHQAFDNDYFLRIPNITPSVTEIYAHYFPSELYDYTEDEEIFSVYDFSDFIKDGQLDEEGNPQYPVNQWDGMEYPLQISSYGYEMLVSYDNKPLIRSLLKDSVTRYKDPNYKNYISAETQNLIDMTEKGRFPLSSRYRNSLYRTAPNFNDSDNFKLPYWKKDTVQYSHGAQKEAALSTEEADSVSEGYKYEDNTATNSYVSKYGLSDKCAQRQSKIPYWEAKIHRSGLSPLIDDTPEDADDENPINVYLNYQYLPTSTEYHQHYFGFEKHNVKTTNGDTINKNQVINAVETYIPDKNGGVKYDAATTQRLKEQLHEYTNKIKNGTYKQITENKTYEVLDGEGLININQAFGNDDKTYRLIRHGNPFDSSSSMYLKHENIYDINLDKITITDNCIWQKNLCDKYWTYVPKGAGAAYLNLTLKAHTPYVLKYFIFIPADAYIEEDSCYVEVQNTIKKEKSNTNVSNQINITASNNTISKDETITLTGTYTSRMGTPLANKRIAFYIDEEYEKEIDVIGELPQAFKDQDKNLRHQWIYHEIPFYTYEQNNRIVIKGPQHNHEGIVKINTSTNKIVNNDLTDEEILSLVNNQLANEENFDELSDAQKIDYYYQTNNMQLHDCKNDVIHFYSMQIAEMVEYSPTIKYTKHGLYVTEGDQYAKKSLKESQTQTCTDDITSTTRWNTKEEVLQKADEWINRGTTHLPTPLTDIYIYFDDDFSIIYNKLTTELSYTKGNYPFIFEDFNKDFDTFIKWTSDDTIINLQYDRNTAPVPNITPTGNETQEEAEKRGATTLHQNAENRNSNDENISKLFLGELRLFNTQRKVFTTGINNEFKLKLKDAYGAAIQGGEVECSIWTLDNEENTPCGDAERCLGVQKPDEFGTIAYEHLNFRNFKPSRQKYYLRIKYRNPCYDREITKWKELIFVEEYRNMTAYANECDKKICFNNSACCIFAGSSIYNDAIKEYENTIATTAYNITSVEELPLRLDVKIRSQPINNNNEGNIINEGYCELSVDDKIVQTTFVDDNGIADFYLDELDLEPGINIIKIEYYTEPYESINFVYFPINCNVALGYDERPGIDISINKLTNQGVEQLSDGLYSLARDDIFFMDIDTAGHKDFSITIQKNNETENETEIINVNEVMTDSYTVAAMWDEHNNRDKYIITTGNLKNPDGTDANSLYRTSKKEFTVIWQSS